MDFYLKRIHPYPLKFKASGSSFLFVGDKGAETQIHLLIRKVITTSEHFYIVYFPDQFFVCPSECVNIVIVG